MKRNQFRNHVIEELSRILARKKILNTNEAKNLADGFKNQDDIFFEDFLLEEEIVSKPELLQALSQYYHIPALDVVGEFFDHHFLTLVPKNVMTDNLFIPYQREADTDTLWVVAAHPNDPNLRVLIGKYISHHIEFMVGIPQDIIDAIEEFYDRSSTYQPNSIASQYMERSSGEVHPTDQEIYTEKNHDRIPLINEETDDDYESY